MNKNCSINAKGAALDGFKIIRLSSRKRFVFHALFLGAVFGLLGWFLIGYGFLSPIENSQAGGNIQVVATGAKGSKSKSSEVWFYGAFRVGDDKKISWGDFIVDPSWERRDDIYVSYKNQPNAATIKYDEPVRLDFGAHPYSGLVDIKWNGNTETIDLYSKESGVKSFFIDQRASHRDSILYPLIIIIFVFGGVFLAAGLVFFGLRKTYQWIFFYFFHFQFI